MFCFVTQIPKDIQLNMKLDDEDIPKTLKTAFSDIVA